MGHRPFLITTFIAVIIVPAHLQAQAEFMKKGHTGFLGQFGYTSNDYRSVRSLGISIGVNDVLNLGGSYTDYSSKYGGEASGYDLAVEILLLRLKISGSRFSLGPSGGFSSISQSVGVLHAGGTMYLTLRAGRRIQVVPTFTLHYNGSPAYPDGGFTSRSLGLGFLAVAENGLGILVSTSYSMVAKRVAYDNTTLGISIGIFFDAGESKESRNKRLFGE